MSIILRSTKGTALTHNEMDNNFVELRDGVNLMVPKDAGSGIKVDSQGTPTYGWHDIHGSQIFDSSDPNGPTIAVYRGNVRQPQFAEGDQLTINFHMPHDYVPGTDIFIHVHWSHNSTTLTGGSVTWGFESMFAKGFDQDEFDPPKIISVAQAASTVQYQHMIAEGAASISGGSATQMDSDALEVDGIFFVRMYLDSNDLTDSVSPPDPFVHFVDLHYQSTNVATKNKAPNFYG